MATIFTRIINGEIPCYKIAENERCFAFLDINPVQKGHVLVIPKTELDYFFDLDDEDIVALQLFSKKIAKAIKKTFGCKKVAQVVLGMEVPHAHVHLIPMNSEGDVCFGMKQKEVTKEEFESIAEAIKANL